jgi:hypothetical protein
MSQYIDALGQAGFFWARAASSVLDLVAWHPMVQEDWRVKIRSPEELASVADPAWPHIERLVAESAAAVRVLPLPEPGAGLEAMFRLQVTAASTLGAMAATCGAILADHGWLKLLGAGHDGLPSLPDANGLGEPGPASAPPDYLVVGYDVLGGTFAVNGGGLAAAPGEICYFGPDTLDWTPLGLPGHSALLRWAVAGGPAETFTDLRWDGWQSEVSALPAGKAIFCFPPLWAAEARGGQAVQRSAVPLAEAIAAQQEYARQLAAVPEGQPVRIQITDN